MGDWTLLDAARLRISEEEFQMAWDVVDGLVSGRVVPLKSPSEHGSVSIEDDGEVVEVKFADTGFTRMMFAIRDLFGRENPKWMACFMRVDATHSLLRDEPRMQRWFRDVDGSGRIFEGVLDTAATVPLRDGGEEAGWYFDADEFLLAVEAIYESGKYRDTGEVW